MKIIKTTIFDEFRTKNGLDISVKKMVYNDIIIYELICNRNDPKKACLYIHGGPNLSCLSYISDTKNGLYRSVEILLSSTNLIFVEQKIELNQEQFIKAADIDEKFGVLFHASRYCSVINLYKSEGYTLHIFAQSFGALILFKILPQLSSDSIESITLGSPYLGVKDENIFVKERRKKTMMLSSFFSAKYSNSITNIRKRIASFGDDTLWHKLSLYMSHPAYPPGIVEKKLEGLLTQLSNCTNSELNTFFTYESTDLINFLIGSKYFTPNSNIYLESKKAYEDNFDNDIADECYWLCKQWDDSIPKKYLSEAVEQKEDLYEIFLLWLHNNHHELKIYFDTSDSTIPIQYYIDEYLINIETSKYKLDIREGYGHWMGNYIHKDKKNEY